MKKKIKFWVEKDGKPITSTYDEEYGASSFINLQVNKKGLKIKCKTL